MESVGEHLQHNGPIYVAKFLGASRHSSDPFGNVVPVVYSLMRLLWPATVLCNYPVSSRVDYHAL